MPTKTQPAKTTKARAKAKPVDPEHSDIPDASAAPPDEASLLLDADAADEWNEFIAGCAALRMITIVVDGNGQTSAIEKWEEAWEKLTEVQRSKAAYFLTFVTGLTTRHLDTDMRTYLRDIGARWLLPGELIKAPESTAQMATVPTSATGTDG